MVGWGRVGYDAIFLELEKDWRKPLAVRVAVVVLADNLRMDGMVSYGTGFTVRMYVSYVRHLIAGTRYFFIHWDSCGAMNNEELT